MKQNLIDQTICIQSKLNKLNDLLIDALKQRIEIMELQIESLNQTIKLERDRAFDEGYSACEEDIKIKGRTINYEINLDETK